MNIGKIGMLGEQATARYLRSKGYEIRNCNYACRFGEIDIVAQKGTQLAFVEVKTRKEDALVSGLESVDSHKQKRLTAAAQDYYAKISKTESAQPRFDVAEVIWREDDTGKIHIKLHYYKNAF